MSNGTKWSAGKIFLLIVGILAGLGILCCGGIWIVAGDKIMAGIHFGTDSAAFAQDLQKEYGSTAIFGLAPNDKQEFILTIGVDGELTPERVAAVQDGAWRAVGRTFGEHGFFPVKYVAIGHPVAGAQAAQQGSVVDWASNTVSVEELVARTGVAAPPNVKFLPDDFNNKNVKITVGTNRTQVETTDEPKNEPEAEEGGGAGSGGK